MKSRSQRRMTRAGGRAFFAGRRDGSLLIMSSSWIEGSLCWNRFRIRIKGFIVAAELSLSACILPDSGPQPCIHIARLWVAILFRTAYSTCKASVSHASRSYRSGLGLRNGTGMVA